MFICAEIKVLEDAGGSLVVRGLEFEKLCPNR
jgi:hypothetical protein